MKIAVIGVGVVGRVLYDVARTNGVSVLGFDSNIPEFGKLNNSILDCPVAFVSVPTPSVMGLQDLSAIHNVMSTLLSLDYRGVVCLRSTVLPGTCAFLNKTYSLRLTHMPEFLTELHAQRDFITQPVIWVSGKSSDTEEVVDALFQILPSLEGVTRSYEQIPAFETTEMQKYFANCFKALKVTFCNEIFDVCAKVGIDYESVRKIACEVPGVGSNHTRVPGPDGRGFSGMCLTVGHRISTKDGYKTIEDIEEGDDVSDQNGITQVTKVLVRPVPSVIKISSCGRTIQGTSEHIHMVYEKGKVVQKLLKDVKINDWLCLVKPTLEVSNEIVLGPKKNGYCKWWPETLHWSAELSYLVGLYLADGCFVASEYAAVFSLGLAKNDCRNRLKKCLEFLGLPYGEAFIEKEGTYGLSKTWRLRIRSAGMAELFKVLGLLGNSHTKRFPSVPKEFILDAVAGWLDGDGHSEAGTLNGFSRSTEMILDIDSLLLSVGINGNISKNGQQLNISQREDLELIMARTTRHNMPKEHYVREKAYQSPNKRKTSFGWVTRVTKIEETGENQVVSLETKSGTYIANNILTHNCFPKDTSAFELWASHIGSPVSTLTSAITSNLVHRRK